MTEDHILYFKEADVGRKTWLLFLYCSRLYCAKNKDPISLLLIFSFLWLGFLK